MRIKELCPDERPREKMRLRGAKALSNADIIVLAEIYAAREKNTIGISSGAIKEKLDVMGKQCEYFHTFEEIENYLKKISSTGDLLITMGAGNIVDVGEDLLKE
jgi:UDP-N-acetylmuramate--alanine ligase